MKNSKRFLAMMTAGFLAITPMAATAMTAYAVTHTLTVTDTDTVAHTYKAYPIILGTKNTDGSLTGISWGTNVDSAALISALTTNATALGITVPATPTIDDIAEVLAGITDADKIEKLAKILNTDAIRGTTGTPLSHSGDNYSATVDDGWYLVVDETSLAAGTSSTSTQVRSANLLQVVGNITINAKHSLPSLEKKIVAGGSEVDYNTASIGDTITYHINTKVPDTRGYEKYFFIVDDTFSDGLTFQSVSSIIVYDDKDDGDGNTDAKKTLALDTGDYTDTTGDYYVVPGDNTVKIVFENIIDRLGACTPGDDIVITYTAKLNSNAVITNTGNTNTAKLTYSNDPNVSATGKDASHPDEPGGDTPPVGETPPDTVKTYTTAIKIKKVDTSGNVLEGAGFTLTGVSSGQALVITNSFNADAGGDYWKLKDGTYTTTNPNDDGVDKTKYESETTKYAKTTTTTLKGTGQTETNISAMVGNDGYIVFRGLGAGTYKLTESTIPDSYNGISPIEFTIAATPDSNSANWVLPAEFSADGDNTYLNTIENRKGSILPTTGGIGTKLFYIIGGLLVTGSVVLLVTKKRMKANEE